MGIYSPYIGGIVLCVLVVKILRVADVEIGAVAGAGVAVVGVRTTVAELPTAAVAELPTTAVAELPTTAVVELPTTAVAELPTTMVAPLFTMVEMVETPFVVRRQRT